MMEDRAKEANRESLVNKDPQVHPEHLDREET